MTNYKFEDLMSEKKKVKTELKHYDQAFMAKFSRVPNRTEKEPMRNLYLYYKRLKQYIHKKEQIINSNGTKGGYHSDQGTGSNQKI